MTDLQSLLARLEEATGPDRSIDIAMWEAFEPHKYLYAQSGRTWAVNRSGTALNPVWEMCADPRMPVTASIDAAFALVERVLPGWGVEFLMSDRDTWRARVWAWGSETNDERGQWLPCYAPTPALAILIALVRDKIAEATND